MDTETELYFGYSEAVPVTFAAIKAVKEKTFWYMWESAANIPGHYQ